MLVPVFVFLMVTSEMTRPGYRIAAALVFGVASLTDFADGWIARAFNQVTSFGKVADPIADKALIGTALVLLSAYGALPWWVTVVILIREVGVTGLRFWVLRYGLIPASRGGKAKTVLHAGRRGGDRGDRPRLRGQGGAGAPIVPAVGSHRA